MTIAFYFFRFAAKFCIHDENISFNFMGMLVDKCDLNGIEKKQVEEKKSFVWMIQ